MEVRNAHEEDNWRRMAFVNRLKAETEKARADLLEVEMHEMQKVINRLRQELGQLPK